MSNNERKEKGIQEDISDEAAPSSSDGNHMNYSSDENQMNHCLKKSQRNTITLSRLYQTK